MNDDLPSGMRATLLLHGVVGFLIGLAYLISPETVGVWFSWQMYDPIYRVIGAALIGFAASSLLAYRAGTWDQVRVVVEMEIVWLVLGGLASLWGLLTGGFPSFAWFYLGVFVAFAAAFGYFYLQTRLRRG